MAVLNKHHGNIPPDAVYIGRGSRWGNPFKMNSEADRDHVCEAYEGHLVNLLHQEKAMGIQDTGRALAELHGKDLVCYCAPKRCHGDVLVKYAALAYTHFEETTP